MCVMKNQILTDHVTVQHVLVVVLTNYMIQTTPEPTANTMNQTWGAQFSWINIRVTSHTSQELWPWNCVNPKDSVQRPS